MERPSANPGTILVAAAVASIAACRAPSPAPAPGPVRATLDALYSAFDFDAGGEADWDGMRALFLEGAAFVAPIRPGGEPRAVDAGQFVADFQDWVRTTPVGATGLHERIVHARIEQLGDIAHAWVAFEGVVPGTGEVRTRGVDAIQLARTPRGWRVVSFTTHYGSEDAPIPARFLGD